MNVRYKRDLVKVLIQHFLPDVQIKKLKIKTEKKLQKFFLVVFERLIIFI